MKAILFDFGGTIDTEGIHWSEKFWDAYQKLNISVNKSNYEKAFVSAEPVMLSGIIKSDSTFYNTLLQQVLSQLKYLKKNSYLSGEFNEEKTAKTIVDICYADVKETIKRNKILLEELNKSYILGLVSNFYGNIESVLKEFDIDHLFYAVVDSGVIGIRKPDPEIFRISIAKLNVEANETYMVGDSYSRDIAPAKSIGCKTIWLDGRSYSRPAETNAADFTVRSLEETRNIFLDR